MATFGLPAQVTFPAQRGYLRVFNPLNRYAWDLLILILIVVVMVVAPFEITFVSQRTSFKTHWNASQRGIFVTNCFIDACFVVDILLALNTAHFDHVHGRWVLDRRKIFVNYLETWLLPDVLSVIPYEWIPVPKSFKVLKMIKLVRFVKLLRVLKQPRIMSRIMKHMTMRAQAQTVIKYFLIVVFQIHWGACVLRAIDGALLKDCPLAHVTMRYPDGDRPEGPGHACPLTVLGFFQNQGIWSTYLPPRGSSRDESRRRRGVRRGHSAESRRGAAAATWTFRGDRFAATPRPRRAGDESRRRRGYDVDIPRRRIRGDAGCDVDIPRRRIRGDAAAATWIFRGDGFAATPRPRRGHSVQVARLGHFGETKPV